MPQEQGRKLIEVFLTITGKWFWNSKPVSMEEKKKRKEKRPQISTALVLSLSNIKKGL